MALSYRIVTIGTLSRNRCWNESAAKRSAYSTTTLIRHGSTNILVDPGVPEQLIQHQLNERAGMTPADIDLVFLTTFRPVHRRSLAIFEKATWIMYEPEIQAVRRHLDEIDHHSGRESDEKDLKQVLLDELALLEKIKPADEKVTPAVHLYPTPGITPGSAGLLLALPSRTAILAGDAVVTQDYYEAGRIFEQILDLEQAQQTFADIMEIADEIIPGHDNLFTVTGR